MILYSDKFSRRQKFAKFLSFYWINLREREISRVLRGEIFTNKQFQKIWRDIFSGKSSFQTLLYLFQVLFSWILPADYSRKIKAFQSLIE